MRKKLFTFLLALVTSVGLSWATVITWDQSKVSTTMAMNVSSGSDSRTSDGITVTVVSTGEFVVFGDHGGAIEIGNGEGSGGGYLTFTSTVGNIAQIDIYHSGAGEWRNANGDWISPYYENFEGGIFTWSGTPAASITLTGDAPRHIDDITSIEFTIENGGGSTPTPTPSATGGIFANCYDCQRDPSYPTNSGYCNLYYFRNPYVGNGNPSGPWKLEFVEYYNPSNSSTEYGSIVDESVANQYGKSPEQMEVYRLYQWQNGAYQPVAYGVLYAYANENNPVEHAAFFEANGHYGCYLTGNTHSYNDDIYITFNEDAATGFADLHGGSTPAVDPTPTPSGDGDKLAGAFSVGGDKVVYFSKANLQATTADNGATWTWGFAENQWDYVGNNAANNAINGGGTVSTNGPVDLFAWSSTANNYFGINNSINEADYSGDFKDWGAKMGSDWRTLTINEWQYLLQDRNPGSSSANYTSYPRYTNAQILTDGTAPQKDIKGIILFPDDFNDGGESIDGVTWGSINPSFFSSSPTTCTTAGWATLESMGCVFLPSAGSRQNFEDEFAIVEVAIMGNYWSSTLYSGEPEDPQSIVVGGSTLGIGTSPRYWGMSVRLVSETAPSGGSTPANVCGDGLTWELSEGVLTISYDGVGTGEMYDFDYEYDQNPVNVAPWKENKSEIATVVIGDGVKSIGNHAFNDLSENFTAVTIANSVERIGLNAFLNSEEITEITLPSSLKTIDEQGFANCGFTSITIPSGVTSIGYKAFCYCRDLTSLTCEATTPPALASSVFYKVRSNTSSLSSIPLYVPSESVAAYQAASQWNDFGIQGYAPTPTSASGSCGDGLTWELSEGVLTISYDGVGTGEMYDFDYEYDQNPVNVAPWKENKSEIATVVIGDGVKSIGNHAFNDLSENFTAVTIANSVERIGLNAFLNSEEITEITLPSSLKTIDEQGFANCGFTSITIPSGVTSIGYKAFCYCRDLTSLTCEATTPPALASSVFYKVRSNTSSLSSIPLYVPSGSVTAYEAAAQWNDFDIRGYDPASTPAYTVAGEPAVAFGTPTWAPANTDNDMVKQSNGTYKWEKEGVELAKDAVVSFKVCQDHGWDVAYPNDNFNHTIPADGIYTLTITFDPNAEGDKVAINALKTADVVVVQTAEMKGFGDWNTGIALENINEGAAARVTKNLAAGAHEFKMIINDGWRGKVGATITRANNTVAEIVDNPNESNITLTADIPGDYTFTWTYAENTLSVEFPSLVVYVQNLIAAIGEVNLESGDAINAARTAYDNLLDADQKQAVNNYSVLEAAEIAYAALAQAAADQLAANNVKNLIDAIDNPVVYTQACKDKIDAARAAYDALTDAQKTLVGDEYAQKLADAEAAYDAFIVYTVAGEPEALFGSFWNIGDTNNDMVKQSNGTYKWEKTDVALAAGTAKFKIIKDHVTYEYPTSNYELQIEEDGIYTVTIIYDPKAAEDRITTNALKTGEAVIVHTAEMKGSWNNWTDGLELENINEGAAARATKILTPGTYEFKMIIDGSWLGEASTTFTRNENAKAEIGGDEDNLKLNADIPGCYTFTWTYETNTLEIGYPNYIDADFAIDFRTDPYTKVGGGDLPAGVLVEGSMNTGDAQHGYRLPVITIPVTAGNYKVMMGTCSYSNQDATIKTEDNSYTYATLETNNGTCYHQNTATNVVGAIFNVPSDQIIKVYGAEYTPFFSIEKMAAVPAFTDFELNFQTNPYNEISGAKPEGTVIAGSFHDGQHGYQNVEATVPVKAGKYRLTLGACGYGNGAGNVMSETNVELASFNQKLAENDKCYHQDPANNIVSMIFDVDQDQTITIDCGQYTPYMKLEAVTAYQVSFALSDAEGSVPAAVDVTVGEGITMPLNKTMYKEGYTLTGWSDGVNTYPIGESFTPANDVVLTPVFTANEADLLNASTDVNVKWYFGGDNGAPTTSYEGTSGLLVAQATIGDKTVDVKLAIDATSGKFAPQPTTEWAQVRVGTIFTYPYKEGMTVDVHTYSGNVTYYLADGNVTCGTNDYYSFIEVTYPASAPTTAVVIGDPNDADQVTAFLSTYEGQTVPNLTIDRPVLNNMYNTLCLPFNMDADQIANSSLNGVEIYEFVDVDVTNDELYLYTSEEKHEIVAGRPYLVKFSAASQLDDLNFINVVINNADLDDQAVTIKGVTFKGTFQPIVLGKQTELNFNGGHLFLMANNTLMWPNTNNPLKPFRAYFTVNVDAGQSAGMPVRRGMPAHIGGPAQIVTGVDQISQEPMANSQKLMENGVLYIIKNGVKYNAQGQIVK